MRPRWHHTVEQLAKMSTSHLGLKASPETCAKISVALMGRTFSPETCAKLSAVQMGRIVSDETRAKISVAEKGKTMSPEARAKDSAVHMGHTNSPEARAKMSVAHWKGGRSVWMRKQNAKRRLLGFNPLNSWFVGCEGHHINPLDVIHMPKKLHKSIYHNQYTGKGMAEMNVLAGAFLTEDWT